VRKAYLFFGFCFFAVLSLLFIESRLIKFDNSVWLSENNKFEIEKKYVEDNFLPYEEFVVAIDLGKDFLEEEIYNDLIKFTQQLEEIDIIKKIQSPLDATEIFRDGEIISISNFSQALEDELLNNTDEYRKKIKNSFYYGRLVSKDFKKIIVSIELDIVKDNNKFLQREKFVEDITSLLANNKSLSNYHLSGGSYLNYKLDSENRKNLQLILSLAVISLSLMIFLIYRSLTKFLIVLLSALAAISFNFLSFLILDVDLNIVALTLPVLIIVIAVSDSIYILAKWDVFLDDYKDRKLLLFKVIRYSWKPCFLTSVTTAIGFGSFYFSEILPLRELGKVAVFAIMLAYVGIVATNWFCLFLFSDILSKSPDNIVRIKLNVFLDNIVLFVERYHKKILSLSLLILLLFAAAFNLIYTETNFLDVFFKKSSPTYKSFDFVDKHLGGSRAIDLVFRADADFDFQNIENFRTLKNAEQNLLDEEIINDVMSYIDPVQMVHREFRNDNQKLPISDQQLQQEILFLEFSRGSEKEDVLSPYLNFDYSAARFALQTDNLSSFEIESLQEKVKSKLQKLGLKNFFLAGDNIYTNRLSEYVIDTQIVTILITFLFIYLIFVIDFGHRIALIGLVPNIMPVIITLGLVSYLRIPFDFATVLIASISFGIAVDSSIHFLHIHKYYYKQGARSRALYTKLLHAVGKPMIYNCILFSLAFALFLFADLVVLIKFGFFSMIASFLSLIANLYILPSLLLAFHEK
jgi:uncharacterized protein